MVPVLHSSLCPRVPSWWKASSSRRSAGNPHWYQRDDLLRRWCLRAQCWKDTDEKKKDKSRVPLHGTSHWERAKASKYNNDFTKNVRDKCQYGTKDEPWNEKRQCTNIENLIFKQTKIVYCRDAMTRVGIGAKKLHIIKSRLTIQTSNDDRSLQKIVPVWPRQRISHAKHHQCAAGHPGEKHKNDARRKFLLKPPKANNDLQTVSRC